MKNIADENVILEIIRERVGEENAITDNEIRNMFIIPDSDRRKPTAGLRDIINSLRQQEYPICSGVNGYWWATDAEELNKNIEALEGRAIKIFSATKGMRYCLNRWNTTGQASLML